MNNFFEQKKHALPNYGIEYLEVKIHGGLDKTTAKDFDEFFRTLNQEKCPHILLLLSDIATIDSTGIALLANFNEEFKKSGISLKFVDVPKKISQLFEMLGLSDFFSTFVDVRQALASFMTDEFKKNSLLNDPDWATPSTLTPGKLDPPQEKQPLHTPSSKNDERHDIEKNIEIDEDPESEELGEKEEFKRLKTIKIKKKNKESERHLEEEARFFTMKLDYFENMVCGKSYPMALSIVQHGEKKRENGWEIMPKIPGCLVVPPSLKIKEAMFPFEFCFSITPLGKSNIPAELLLTTPQGYLRQFQIKMTSHKLTVPIFLYGFGLLVFLGSLVGDLFEITLKKPFSFWAHAFQLLASTLIGSPFYGLLFGSLISFGGILYYQSNINPKRGSLQIHFYER